MKIKVGGDYRKRRKDEYPDLAEFADAYYWKERGNPAPMETYLKKVDAVKAKFKKDKQ